MRKRHKTYKETVPQTLLLNLGGVPEGGGGKKRHDTPSATLVPLT